MLKYAIVVGIFSAFLGSLNGAAHAADIRTCQIEQISGDAVAVRTTSAQHSWTESIAGVAGLDIPATSTVETGPKSRVVLQCDDTTIITVGPDTEIALTDLIGKAGPEHNVLLKLLRGIVGIVAPNQTWNRFEVETSVAVASVRSTEWLVESYTGSGTAVFVDSGSVEVLSNQQAYVLAPGEGVTLEETVTKGLEPVIAEVKSWGAARIAKSRSALGFDWE